MAKNFIDKDWVDKFWVNLNRTSQMLKSAFSAEVKKSGHKILTEQWVILMSLHQKGPLSQVEIAKLNYKHTPSISRSLNFLEKKNLIKRVVSSDDKRYVKVHLLEEGEALIADLYPNVLSIREQSWNGLTEKDFNELIRILSKVQDNLLSAGSKKE